MLRNFTKILAPLTKSDTFLASYNNLFQQQLRTTFILKRQNPPNLTKKGFPAKNLRGRHHVYELVKDTVWDKQPEIDVILTSYVDNLGNVGDRVSVKPMTAYHKLLLPGLAVYATPENIKTYENTESNKDTVYYSSPYVPHMINAFQKMTLSVIMNKDTVWTIQPWHIKASFRKAGFIVPEDAIEIPAKTIKGADLNLENKEFYITVTINNKEKVNVRCRIHHWSTEISEKLPYEEQFWLKPAEPIFPEDVDVLDKLPSKWNTDKSDNVSK